MPTSHDVGIFYFDIKTYHFKFLSLPTNNKLKERPNRQSQKQPDYLTKFTPNTPHLTSKNNSLALSPSAEIHRF